MHPALTPALDEIVRDLDLLVFELETESSADLEQLEAERERMRRTLERLRDRLDDLVQQHR